MSSSLHIMPLTAPSAYASCTQFAIGPIKYCPRIVYQMSIMFLYHMIPFIMLYHPFFHAMSYAPMLTHHWTFDFPMTHSPFFLADSFIFMTHFISGPTSQSLCPYFLFLLKWSMLWNCFTSQPLLKTFDPSHTPWCLCFFIAVLFIGRTFVESCHSNTFVFILP